MGRFISSAAKKRCCGCIWKPSARTVTSDALVRCCQTSQLLCKRRGHTWAAARRSEEPHFTVLFIPAGVCFCICVLGKRSHKWATFSNTQTFRRTIFCAHRYIKLFFLCTHTGICFLHNGFFLIYSLIRIKANKMRAGGSELIFYFFSWSGYLRVPPFAGGSVVACDRLRKGSLIVNAIMWLAFFAGS